MNGYHLLPLSRAELIGVPIKETARRAVPRRPAASKKSGAPAGLFETLFMGFCPRIHDKRLRPQVWLGNYYQTYLERDVPTSW